MPNVPGQLSAGGALFMLKVKNTNQLHLGTAAVVGTIWDLEWVRVADPGGVAVHLRAGPRARRHWIQSARRRVVGHDDRLLPLDLGRLDPERPGVRVQPGRRHLTLIYNSPDFNDCDNPDNMTVTPRGGLLLCEDAAGGVGGDVSAERLIGLTLTGTSFTFAINNISLPLAYNDRIAASNYRSQEWAGACYSPDGRWLFANIQTPGVTFAITGPWALGPL